MVSEIKLSPEELFFLGSKMNAKYIDYAYIASIDNFADKITLIEKEALASLEEKGLIEEDFGGDMTINNDIENILKPIFFGEKETEIDIIPKEGEEADIRKFHFLDGNIVEVLEDDDREFIIQCIDEITLNKLFEDVSKEFSESNVVDNDKINFDSVSTIISVKMVNVKTQQSFVETMFLIDNSLFAENEDGKVYYISRDNFVSVAKKTMEV